MRVSRFEDLVVWKGARDLAAHVYRITAAGEFARDFGMRNQIRRAALSVMSNIAEGFDRYSRAEFRHFLSIARGSASEVRCQLHLASALGYLPPADHEHLHQRSHEVTRLISALRSSMDKR